MLVPDTAKAGMNSDKRKVLMFPSWYPTKSEPIGGSFFQEQAVALGRDFDFLVAIVEMRSLSLLRAALKLLIGDRLDPCSLDDEIMEPPRAFLFVGYAFNLGKLKFLSPIRFIRRALDKVNERREKELYSAAYEHAISEFRFIPELIYAMTAQVNAIQAVDLGKAKKVPVIVAEHVPFCIDSIDIKRRQRLRDALESANTVLTVSHDKSRQVLMGNINCDPIAVGNLVDQRRFTLRKKKKDALFNILIVASYNFYKDYSTFFKSMAYLREITDRPFRITIVGIAPVKMANIWAQGADEFMTAFKPYGLKDITTIVNSASRDEIVDYYHSADVFVLTSIQEGFPVSVLEAMACGVPVFSTRCGGVEDVVDESCGRIFHVRDYKGLASGLKDLLEGRISFDNRHVREVAVSQYGLEAFVTRMSSIFNGCLDAYSTKAPCIGSGEVKEGA